MVVNLNADFQAAIDFLLNRNEDLRDRTARAMVQGGADVVEMFRKEQLSGRDGSDMGLNIRSGNLYDSLESDVGILGAVITSTISNHDAKYWYHHQVGAGHNPKRLTFEERFQDQGLDIYQAHLEGALEEVFR